MIFPSTTLIWVCTHFSAPKYARLNIGEGEGAHLSENKGVKSECMKFRENSRQMAPVKTICDEYCRSNNTHFAFSFSANVDGKEFAFEVH